MSLQPESTTSPLRGDAFLLPAPWCVVRRQEEGYLLYNPRSDELHLLPPTAFRAYRLCDGVHSVDEVALELAAATQTAEDESRDRVRDFLAALVERGLLLEDAA